MRRFLLEGCLGAFALAAIGCGAPATTYVKSDTTLGRVVVYRNGVAYFERYADVQDGSLKLNVPKDKVDDFLKSLTVVDARTGEPAPISYPSNSDGGGSTIDMKIGVTHPGAGPRRLRLSYVTEAPSWKPSYRVVVGKGGKVDLQGWAIVDNTSGEDWKDVKLGVGSSSAMSFRFDLKGLRLVERETLQSNDQFALAPPIGGASYGGQNGQRRVLAEIGDEVLAHAERGGEDGDGEQPATLAMTKSGGRPAPVRKPGPSKAADTTAKADDAIQRMAQSLNAGPVGQRQIVVEGYAAANDKDKMTASLDRANRLREELVRGGVDPNRIVAVAKGEQQGHHGGARVVEAPPPPDEAKEPKPAGSPDAPAAGNAGNGATASAATTEPIGTSHFESTTTMTVPRGTSAMVSILRSQTEGEVVYLYDPESPRGNAQFPFKTVRFKNPTDSALESGPVSVFGEGRFVGEGLSEPIPAKSVAFVPFALDRQIVVERTDAESDEIARILTVQRGVFSTEIQHTRRAKFTLYNRMPERAVVYLRHTVPAGYTITKAPERASDATPAKGEEHLAGARLFRVELEPNGKSDVSIEEATPVLRTTDIRTDEGLGLIRAYVSRAAADGPLKGQIGKLLELHNEMAKIEQQIATVHEQMNEYRQRMDELHAQLVTLKAVKTAGPLMTHLEKKMQEVSEKLSKATVDVVTLEEKLMIARVNFQTGVGDLSLESKEPPPK
jgi:hypothetical protein